MLCVMLIVTALFALVVSGKRSQHLLNPREMEEFLQHTPMPAGFRTPRWAHARLPESPAVDLTHMSSDEVNKSMMNAIATKKTIKVINLAGSLLEDCKDRVRGDPIKDCNWGAEIEAASVFLGRKLQKELAEPEPDADDLAEKLQWLKDNEAMPFLVATNSQLVRQAHAELTRLSSEIVLEATDSKSVKKNRPEVFFVLALPAAGKTTAAQVAADATGCATLSIGELARSACRNPKAPLCKKIKAAQAAGNAEDPSLSMSLLKDALKHLTKKEHEVCFIVDGFPRSLAHLAEWREEKMSEKFVVSGVIMLEITPAVAKKRILSRSDPNRKGEDTEEVFEERVKFFNEHTLAVLEAFQQTVPQKVLVISAEQSQREVASELSQAVRKLSTSRQQVRMEF